MLFVPVNVIVMVSPTSPSRKFLNCLPSESSLRHSLYDGIRSFSFCRFLVKPLNFFKYRYFCLIAPNLYRRIFMINYANMAINTDIPQVAALKLAVENRFGRPVET